MFDGTQILMLVGFLIGVFLAGFAWSAGAALFRRISEPRERFVTD